MKNAMLKLRMKKFLKIFRKNRGKKFCSCFAMFANIIMCMFDLEFDECIYSFMRGQVKLTQFMC